MTKRISIILSAEELEVLMNALLATMNDRPLPMWAEWLAVREVYSSVWRQAPIEIQDKMERKLREF